jgi:tRNA pseudouridine55 synthase
MTSHDVVMEVKRSLRARKVGHTGTLDPFATGVLVLGINQGTKLIPYVDKTDKEYHGVMVLGVGTDTFDVTGNVVSEASHDKITRDDVISACEDFIGEIEQQPPLYSAVKIDGVRLYELARRGIEVNVAPRRVHIYSLSVADYTPPRVTFNVTCSPGTYIRTLAVDIGKTLGVPAHLERLVRTRSGPFSIDQALSLDDVVSSGETGWEYVIGLRDAVRGMSEVPVDESEAAQITHGAPLFWDKDGAGVVTPGSMVKLIHDGRLLALARVEGKQKIHIKPFKVFHAK